MNSRRRKIRVITVLMLMAMLLNTAILAIPASAAGQNGLTFSNGVIYSLEKDFNHSPNTFEAVIKLPAGYTQRAGVILGNYGDGPSISFEIQSGGHPKLYMNDDPSLDPTNDIHDFIFSDVNVATGEKLHLAIVRDVANQELRCYVDGVLKQTISCSKYTGPLQAGSMSLGGDFRSGNAQYFKGTIYSAAMYSDVRTANEIQSDSASSTPDTDGLIAAYDLNNLTSENCISDLSANNYDMFRNHKSGFIFSADPKYISKTNITQSPNTFEATVYFSADTPAAQRGGVILGNYDRTECVNFEVYTNGNPRIWLSGESIIFDQVSLYNGKNTHVAIVRDAANGKVYCYIDGVLKQEKVCSYSKNIDLTSLVLGGDLRSGNDQYFKGTLLSAAMFSDVRNADTIAADMAGVPSDNALIAYYDLEDVAADPEVIEDKSPNGYDMKQDNPWITEKAPVIDYAYSFAVIGDTQIIARDAKDDFHKIYDYVLDNLESKKIKFVFGLGDITDTYGLNDASTAEWQLASAQIKRMNGKVPYSIVRGNHDEVVEFNQYFPYSEYSSIIGGSYEQNMLNTYQEFSVGNIKYLVFTFDYGPSDQVLAWASDIIEAHPEHNVILTTHSYLYHDGSNVDKICPPATTGGHNNGDAMWDKLIKKHENIVLVLSGHDPWDEIVVTQTKGDNGNTVTQMLVDPQGVDANVMHTGMVAMLYFSADGRNVTVEWYSTIQEKYFKEANQFTMTIDVVESTSQPVNYDELNAAIILAEAKVKADYTLKSWNKLQSALTEAKAALKSTSQTIVDNAADALNAAVEALVPNTSSENGGSENNTPTDEGTDTTGTETKDTQKPADDKKSGCGSVIGGASVVLCATLAIAVGIAPKKREN